MTMTDLNGCRWTNGRFLWVVAAIAFTANTVQSCSCEDDGSGFPIVIGFLFPSSGAQLGAADDTDPLTEGLQITLQIGVLNYSGQGTIWVEIEGVEESAVSQPATGASTYLFEGFTLAQGSNRLLATLVGQTESPLASAQVQVTASPGLIGPDEPALTFLNPVFDGQILGQNDDVDLDLDNGFQLDVIVGSDNIALGSEVTLEVENGETATGTIDADGLVTFPAVTLPETVPGETLTLTAQTAVGDDVVEALRFVSVVTGSCLISLQPPTNPDGCEFLADSTDADPDQEGIQTEVVVTTDCAEVTLTVNVEEMSATVEAGEVAFPITLDEGRNILRVDARDSQSSRTGTTGNLEYRVDTVTPLIDLQEPNPEGSIVIGPVLDRNPDADGVQIDVVGTAAGVPTGTLIEARVNGTVVATASTDAGGAFRVEDVTFEDEGEGTLEVLGSDDCGNPGTTGEIDVTVITESGSLTIVSPEDGTLFVASDDADPDTEGFQADFEVATSSIVPDTRVRIECRRTAPPYVEVGAAERGTDEPFTVRATLPDGQRFCRAFAEQELGIPSSEVQINVDSIVPVVEITEPEDGSGTNIPSTTLAAFVSNIDATGVVTYTVNDGDPVEVDFEVSDGGFVEPDVPLEAGPNVIEVIATDGSGNTGSDSVTVTYDIQPPTLTFVDPAGDTATLEQSDLHINAPYPANCVDYLYDVQVRSDEATEDGELCLVANRLAEQCVTAVQEEDEDSFLATFTDTFVLPGDNDLDARAVDLAGNEGTAHQDLTVDSSAARLEIVEARAVDETGETVRTFDPLDGAFIGWAGRLDVVVEYDDIGAGNRLQLMVGEPGGTPTAAVTVTPTGGSPVIFESFQSHLTESTQSLLARVVAPDLTPLPGCSALIDVTVDLTAPVISFRDLTDGGLLTTVDFDDVSPAPGFQAAIVIDIADIEDDVEASLAVDCSDDAFDAETTATVASGQAVFEVSVPSVGSCTFTANVSDLAGNPAEPAVASVSVDVSPPVIVFSAPEDEDVIDFTLDLEPGGQIQINVRVSVQGAVGQMDLEVNGVAQPPRTITGDGIVTFPSVTLPDGEVTLTATARDSVGNQTSASIGVTVISDEVTLTFSNLRDEDVLNSSSDTDELEPGLQIDVTVIASGSFPGETIILCLQSTGPPPSETQCSDADFEDIATSTMGGDRGTFFDVTLPEGEQVLSAEMLLGGSPVVVTPIDLLIDSIRPTITSWELLNDDGAGGSGAGDAILNLAEAPGAMAQLRVTFAGLGGVSRPVSIYADTTNRISPALAMTEPDGTYTLTAGLAQGGHVIRAVVTDVNGNGLASTAPKLNMAMDTVPPTITWEFPANGGTILATADKTPGGEAQVDAVVFVNGVVTGTAVTVTGATVTTPPLTVAADKRARGEISIPEGDSVAIGAAAVDTAFNPASRTATLLVDVTPPTIAMEAPPDADPDTAGVQVEDADTNTDTIEVDVTVNTTNAEVTSTCPAGRCRIIISTDVGGGFDIGSANITSTSGGDDAATTVVRVEPPGGSQTWTARVTDDNGNIAMSAGLEVDVPVVGCGLIFLDPPGSPLLVDASGYSGTPPDDPKTLDMSLEVLNPDCVGRTPAVQVELRFDCARSDAAVCDTCDARRSGCVLTAPVVDSGGGVGLITFDDVPFYDGEDTTLHGRAPHPDGEETSYTEQKDVLVDLVPPTVSITDPDGTYALDLQLEDEDEDWDNPGGTTLMQGPVSFTTGAAAGGTYTIRYNGAVLNDPTGAIQDDPITSDGGHVHDDVQFPTVDEGVGAELEVEVADEVGNTTSDTVALNVDADAPSAPGAFALNFPADRTRSGYSQLTWTASVDDGVAAGGGGVAGYEVRSALEDVAGTWDDIDIWNAQTLVTELGSGATSHTIDSLTFDEDYVLGVRAFDEVDNPGTVAEVLRSTAPVRHVWGASDIGTFGDGSGRVIGTVGDVNGDGSDDLLVSADAFVGGSTVLILGVGSSEDPDDAVILPLTTTVNGGGGGAGDLNGDGLDDFFTADFFSDSIYIYFGTTDDNTTDGDANALIEHDVVISAPSFTAIYSAYSGRGDFVDIGTSDCDPGAATPECFDDFYFNSFHANPDVDAFVVIGRSDADWGFDPGGPDESSVQSFTIVVPDDSDATSANCDEGVISILGASGTQGEHSDWLASSGGFAQIDDDQYVDLVIGTYYDAGVGQTSVQYLFYGRRMAACPSDGWELAAGNDADGVFENDDGDAPEGFHPSIHLDGAVFGGGGAMTRGGEWVVGIMTADMALVYQYGTSAPAVYADITIPVGQYGLVNFGRSVSYVGNFDQDADDTVDLAIGATGTAGQDGRVYLVFGTTDTPRFATQASFQLDGGGVGQKYGFIVTGGFDFNADGAMDLAVADTTSNTVTLFH